MRQEGEQAASRAGKEAPAQTAPDGKELPPRYIRVSVYVTDARTNEPVEDTEVMIGAEQLLPTPLPREYGENPAGLYATETLEGGSYLFRARRKGFRSVVGRLSVPPVPEIIASEDPPLVLELEDIRESQGDDPSFRVMVLWQKYRRTPAQSQAAPSHPPTMKPSGASPHSVTTHPLVPGQ